MEKRHYRYYAISLVVFVLTVLSIFLIRDGVYELWAQHEGNIYRAFFIFDEGNIVMLFNGFQKKSQKTPQKEIEMAIRLKNEYYAEKG